MISVSNAVTVENGSYEKTEDILSDGWTTYSSEEVRFSINHPDDWVVTDDPLHLNDLKKMGVFPDNWVVSFSSPIKSTSDTYSENIIIQKEEFGGCLITLQEYTNIHKKVIELAFDWKIIDTVDINKDENSIRVMTFTGELYTFNVKGKMALLVKDDVGCVLTLNDLGTSYDQYEGIAQDMFKLFKP